jgi:hypothetical protein
MVSSTSEEEATVTTEESNNEANDNDFETPVAASNTVTHVNEWISQQRS